MGKRVLMLAVEGGCEVCEKSRSSKAGLKVELNKVRREHQQ
jgi:hypothetical protein